MAHRRKPLAVALGLNTGVLVVELAGGVQASSLSLVVDAVHNVSDELALGFLVLAYTLRTGLSGRLLRTANLFNSVGLLAVSAFLLWRVVERLCEPVPVLGAVPVIAGLLGAVGNWGVARVLRESARHDAAIRLAYVHNLGDTLLSLAPVVAGALILVWGRPIFDSLVALVIAAVIIVTTIRSVVGSHKELLWPENVVCGHAEARRDEPDVGPVVEPLAH
jgi:cation diffusion facilitator family transporter